MIPNVFHYCYFGGRPFSLVEYLTIKSAYEVNRPEKMFIYMDVVPENDPWWEKAKQFLEVVQTTPPDNIDGIPVPHPAHRADIVRLQKLLEMGGIYTDLDVLCVKPFTPLLGYPVVLGKEVWNGTVNGLKAENAWVGLCNGVLLAEKNATFLQRWLEGFHPKTSLWCGFRSKGPQDLYYSEMSIKYSRFLAQNYPEEIHIEEQKSFFYPGYTDEDLELFFKGNSDELFAEAYCHHLWANAAYERYLKGLTEERIKTEESTFNRLARRYL